MKISKQTCLVTFILPEQIKKWMGTLNSAIVFHIYERVLWTVVDVLLKVECEIEWNKLCVVI